MMQQHAVYHTGVIRQQHRTTWGGGELPGQLILLQNKRSAHDDNDLMTAGFAPSGLQRQRLQYSRLATTFGVIHCLRAG